MAKKFLTDIDLNTNQLQNAVVHALATAPSSGVVGQIYYNTTDKNLYQHDGSNWVVIGKTYTGTSPITVSGTTISHANSGVTAAAKGDTSNQTPAFGGTFKVPSGTVNATGHLTAFADHTVTIPSTEASTSAAGLMSSSDKSKLDGVASGAEVNQNAFSNVTVYQGINVSTIGADSKKDTLTLMGGSNITLTADTTNDKVTIAATDTTYSAGTQALLEAGSDTADRVWQPKIIHDYVASAIGAADAMRFKGTIGTGGTVTALPTSGVMVGDTYRVITAGTYASQTCEIGDLIIATATTPTWTVAQTNIDGAITSISGTSPISVSGSGSSRTVAINTASSLSAGSMSSAHYIKLEGIQTGAEVNQNAFSNVVVGSTTIAADDVTDTLTLVAGSNVTLTPDATNDKVTIAATDTDTKNTAGSTDTSSKIFLIGATSQAANPQTYSHDTAYVGTDGCLYSGGSKVLTAHQTYTAVTGKPTANQTPGFGSTFTISQISQATSGQITATDRTVKIPNTTATTSAAGLMSSSDKSVLAYLQEADLVLAGTTTLTAGQTSKTISLSATQIPVNLTAYDDSGNEVVVDVQKTESSTACSFVVSINSAVSYDITLVYTYVNID